MSRDRDDDAEWADMRAEALDLDVRAESLNGRMKRLARATKLLCEGRPYAAYCVLAWRINNVE